MAILQTSLCYGHSHTLDTAGREKTFRLGFVYFTGGQKYLAESNFFPSPQLKEDFDIFMFRLFILQLLMAFESRNSSVSGSAIMK